MKWTVTHNCHGINIHTPTVPASKLANPYFLTERRRGSNPCKASSSCQVTSETSQQSVLIYPPPLLTTKNWKRLKIYSLLVTVPCKQKLGKWSSCPSRSLPRWKSHSLLEVVIAEILPMPCRTHSHYWSDVCVSRLLLLLLYFSSAGTIATTTENHITQGTVKIIGNYPGWLVAFWNSLIPWCELNSEEFHN